ncbi:MAG: hypothetical protein U0325_25295 [Polyangiales bacterium]
MRSTRTAWHPAFTVYVKEHAPGWGEVRAEVPISEEPLRVDDLLALRAQVPRDASDEGTGLRGLWRAVRGVMLVDFKSRARAFRRGELMRLFAYGLLWCSAHGLPPADVAVGLVVPRVNKPLREEIAELGVTLHLRRDGYHEVEGFALRVVVAELWVVARRERDDILQWFARPDTLTLAAQRWIRQHVHAGSDDMTMQIDEDLEGFYEYVQELMQKLPPKSRLKGLTPEQRLAGLAPEQRLAGLAPEQRLAGLAPEQRLAGLAPEQLALVMSESDRVLALPDAALRALPADYLETLPADAQARIRVRLGR